MEANVPEALTVFHLPEKHRRRLRTTNALERLNQELKRRTRVALIFPNESALERLVTALLMEQSELWETDKTYLNMEKLESKFTTENHFTEKQLLDRPNGPLDA